MRKVLYILLLLLPTLFFSCEIETSGNGKLDGNWQLQFVDTLSTGGICDMGQSGIYWGVENKLLQVRNTESGKKILFRFEKNENTLTIHSPHLVENKYETTPVEDVSVLAPYGISGTEEMFVVEKLSNGRLFLASKQLRLRFRRY